MEDYAIISVCGVPGTLHVYNPRDNAPRHVQTQCHVRAPCMAVSTSNVLVALSQSANSTTAALASHDVGRATGTATRKSASIEPLTVLAISHAQTLLVAGAKSGRVHVWQVATGELLASFTAHLHAVTALAFTDDDALLLTAGADAAVHAFSTAAVVDTSRKLSADPIPVVQLVAHTLPVVALAVGYAGSSARVVTAGADRSLRIWHLASASCLATVLLPAPPVAVALSADEAIVFVGLVDGSIVSVRPATLPLGTVQTAQKEQCILRPASPSGDSLSVNSIALSPNSTELVAGYSDGVVRIFDVTTRTQVHSYSKHSTTAGVTFVTTLARIPDASPNGRAAAAPFSRAPNPIGGTLSSIDMTKCASLNSATWRVIEDAAKLCFPHDEIDAERADFEKGVRYKGGAQEGSLGAGEDIVLDELVHEVAFLRKRNQHLESAGRKLCSLVEKQFPDR